MNFKTSRGPRNNKNNNDNEIHNNDDNKIPIILSYRSFIYRQQLALPLSQSADQLMLAYASYSISDDGRLFSFFYEFIFK